MADIEYREEYGINIDIAEHINYIVFTLNNKIRRENLILNATCCDSPARTELISLIKDAFDNIIQATALFKGNEPDEKYYDHKAFLTWMIKYLAENTDFFEAPASTKFHSAHPGGLALHTLNVTSNLVSLMKSLPVELIDKPRVRSEYFGVEEPLTMVTVIDCILAAFFHDLCKIGMYDEHEDNGHVTYKYNKHYNGLGHGSESTLKLSQFIQTYNALKMNAVKTAPVDMSYAIKESVFAAIYWHMGMYNVTNYDMPNYRKHKERHPLVLLLHYADDMDASWRKE